jgi:predicted nuclease of predicted toxin-antitoxin system
MRLLADENFPKRVVDWLRDSGHDVLWARTDCAGKRDVDLLEMAEREARVIVTLDKDFWQIALQRRTPLTKAGVVLFRVHPATPERIEPLVRAPAAGIQMIACFPC